MTKNVYDQNFRKTSTTAADNTALAATTWLHYDVVGNQDYVTDPRGTSTPGTYTTYTDYDTRNRKWQVRKPLGSTTQFYYDDNINITRIIRAVGTPDVTTETKTYDAMNRVLADTVPQTASISLTTSFTYNPSGTIQKITDPKVHYTWLYYDASDRKITMTYHDNSTQQWAYDNAGNLKSRTTVNGKIQSFTYDNLNRKTQMTWNNTAEWAQFFYDDASHLREAKNGTGTLGQNVIADVTRAVRRCRPSHARPAKCDRTRYQERLVSALRWRRQIDAYVRRRRYGLRLHLFLRRDGALRDDLPHALHSAVSGTTTTPPPMRPSAIVFITE